MRKGFKRYNFIKIETFKKWRARARARRFSRLPNFAGGNAKVRWSLSSSIASFTVLELPANHLKLSGLLKTKYWKHLYVAVYILKGQVDFQTLLIIFTLYTTVYDPHPKFHALFEFCISFSKFSSPEKHCMLFNAWLQFFFLFFYELASFLEQNGRFWLGQKCPPLLK